MQRAFSIFQLLLIHSSLFPSWDCWDLGPCRHGPVFVSVLEVFISRGWGKSSVWGFRVHKTMHLPWHDSSASDLLMEMLGLVISGARNISEWGWVGFRPRESVSRWNLLNDDVFMASRFLMPQRQDFCVVEPTVPTIFAFTALRHHRYLDTLLNVCLLLTACSRFCVVLMTIPGGSGWSVTSFSRNSGNFLSWNFWLRGVLI